MQQRRLMLLFLLLMATGVDWAVAPAPALAFNGKEHTDVSNMALKIALSVVTKQCDMTSASDSCMCDFARGEEVLDLVSPACFAEGRTFGHLVALVDQISGPEAYFASDYEDGALPSGVKDINWRHIDLLRRNPFANLQALHLNEGHFQDAALLRHLLWHQAAISAAREKSLGSAVIFEAYADHFLEDFFAPGHIVTPRASSGDMSSIAVHDKYNRRKFVFYVKPQVAQDLVKMLSAINEQDLRDVPTELALSAFDLEELRKDLEVGRPVEVMGDGFLKASTKETAFLVLVAARSILDLFENRCRPVQDRSFSGYQWKWPPVDEVPVGNAIGHYDLKQSHFSRLDREIIYLPLTAVFVPSITLEAFPRGKIQQIRPAVAFESLFATLSTPEYKSDGGTPFPFQSLAVLLSGSFAWDQNYQAYGLGYRVIYPIPRLDIQFSLAPLAVYLTGRQSWLRPKIQLKAETGFGMLFLSFGVGYDYFIDSAQRLHSGLALSSGASFVLPRSLLRGRIPHYR
jgi:hypothetical protein